MNILKTTTSITSPLDGSGGTSDKPPVSDFITIQSLANFAAMSGAINAAWHALQRLTPQARSLWVPYLFAFAWAFVSFVMSIEGLKKTVGDTRKWDFGNVAGALFIAAINSLVLAGSVVGTGVATGQ